ncbi:MAG: hypothetical protein ABS938_00275 [Psychrobacillus psychrodurans]
MNLSYLRDKVIKIADDLEVTKGINTGRSIMYNDVFIPRIFFDNTTYRETIKKLTENKELNSMVSNNMIIGRFNQIIKNYIKNKDKDTTSNTIKDDLIKDIKAFEVYASQKKKFKIYVPVKGIKLYKDKVTLSNNVTLLNIDENTILEYLPQMKTESEISQLYPTALEVEVVSAEFQKAMEHTIDIGKFVVNYLRLVDYFGWDEEDLSVRLPGYGSLKEELRVFAVDSNWDGVHSWKNREKNEEILEMDHAFFEDLEKWGLGQFGNLLDKYLAFELSNLDVSVLRSITWFGESKVEVDMGARFVKLMLAIESLLNTNSSDPITATLRDRMAFILGETVEQRLEISKKMTELYKQRSEIVHHGSSKVNFENLMILQELTANAILEFLSNKKLLSFKNKKEMQDSFERTKYSNRQGLINRKNLKLKT